jgi:hypothetical protein
MWPHRIFLIAPAADWAVARQRVLLTRRRLGRRGAIRCSTPTSLPPLLRDAPAASVLLRIDPYRLRRGMGYGLDFVDVWGDLPVAAVDAVYPLPLAEADAGGLPCDCQLLYRGQLIKDRADALPTVPSAEQAEQFVVEALADSERDPLLPVADVAEAVADVCGRLSYESISDAVAKQLAAWHRRHWPDGSPPPLRPVPFHPVWRTPTVVDLASAVARQRAFDLLPILRDALEEAGCDNAEVLEHCRQAGEHARGCWLVDLLLGVSPGNEISSPAPSRPAPAGGAT